mmetsp:Transcript_3353/g.9089  ORF Transcript_3353/g.9089 Transcript_3353/m.9089 type:complete len:224 (+) Transcript_3353:2091-2762(+)
MKISGGSCSPPFPFFFLFSSFVSTKRGAAVGALAALEMSAATSPSLWDFAPTSLEVFFGDPFGHHFVPRKVRHTVSQLGYRHDVFARLPPVLKEGEGHHIRRGARAQGKLLIEVHLFGDIIHCGAHFRPFGIILTHLDLHVAIFELFFGLGEGLEAEDLEEQHATVGILTFHAPLQLLEPPLLRRNEFFVVAVTRKFLARIRRPALHVSLEKADILDNIRVLL